MDSAVADLQKAYNIIGRREELTTSLISAKAGKHILLEGAVGVGKTTIALAVTSHLERKYVRIDGDERYTEQKLAGWFDPPLVLSKGYTGESFIHGPLAITMQEGSILLINELNRIPEGTQNVLLSAMDEKTIYIPKYGKVNAKDGFMIIATQNPDEYIGTSQLSEALKDRFICITLPYQPEEEEKEILRLRSLCKDEDIIDVAVIISRITRSDKEIRRGSSVRGAIDIADIFSTAYGSFNDDIDKWVVCAKLAFRTKIELHDFSENTFLELLKGFVKKALSMHRERTSEDFSSSTVSREKKIDLAELTEREKKK